MSVKIFGSTGIEFSDSNQEIKLKGPTQTFSLKATTDDEFTVYNAANKLWGMSSAGLESKPNVPYFFVNTFDGTTFNAGGFTGGTDESTQGHYNSTNGRFTVPISGLYCVFVGVLAFGGSNRVEGAIALNGVDIIYFNSNPVDTFDGPVGLCIKYANAGDYFDTNRKSGTAYAGVNLNHYFGGYLIG